MPTPLPDIAPIHVLTILMLAALGALAYHDLKGD